MLGLVFVLLRAILSEALVEVHRLMPRQAYFGEATFIGMIRVLAAAGLTRKEKRKREGDHRSSTLCLDAHQPHKVHIGPCRE